MPRFVSEFNAALSLQLTKGKWYHLRQPLSLELQPLPWYRWLQMKNSCCQPDRKNMEISSPEEKHRAAQSREFWQSQTTLQTNDIGGGIQILYSARKYCINLFLRNLSVVNGTQPSYFYLFFFFLSFPVVFHWRKYSSLSKLMWCYSRAPKCYVFQVCPDTWPATKQRCFLQSSGFTR